MLSGDNPAPRWVTAPVASALVFASGQLAFVGGVLVGMATNPWHVALGSGLAMAWIVTCACMINVCAARNEERRKAHDEERGTR